MAKKVRVRDMLGYELKEAFKTAKFAVLPFGAVEDHGPVGTLGMDTYPADFFADEVAMRLGGVVLPTLEYGYVPLYTRNRTGSVPVRHEILVGLLEDVLAAAFREGLPGIIVMNGNGPNASVVEAAAERVCNAYPDRFLLFINCYDVLPDDVLRGLFPEDRGDGHAGAWEVSVTQALLPDTVVDVSKFADEPFRPWLGRGTKIYSAGARSIYHPDWMGYEGVIRASSPEKGQKILEASTEVIVKIVEDLLRQVGVKSGGSSPQRR